MYLHAYLSSLLEKKNGTHSNYLREKRKKKKLEIIIRKKKKKKYTSCYIIIE